MKIKLQIFEGPLDLLLYLIKKNEMDIADIPIGEITEQYLQYLEVMKLLDLNIAGEFLVIAATLMHIKSRMLLPPEQQEALEEEEGDPRAELIRRLLEYKRFKEAAAELGSRALKQRDIFARFVTPSEYYDEKDQRLYFETSIFDLLSAFSKIAKDIPREAIHEIMQDRFTVSDKIHEIFHRLLTAPVIKFAELFQKTQEKAEVIAIFLALLELFKQNEIIVRQRELFGEIEILRNEEKAHAQAHT